MADKTATMKRLLEAILFLTVAIIFAVRFFLPLHYAGVMPRVPEPATGRIYRAMVGNGINVYLAEHEVQLLDFVDYQLSGVAVAFMFALYYLKVYRKWF